MKEDLKAAEDELENAAKAYEDAIDSGDPAAIRDARDKLDAAEEKVDGLKNDVKAAEDNVKECEDIAQKADDAAKKAAEAQKAAEDAIKAADGALDRTKAKEELDKLLADAAKVDQSKYTPDTAKKFQDAIDAGKAASANPNSTTGQLNAAKDALNDAWKALVPKDLDEARKVLDGKVATAENVDQSKYTPDTAKKLQDAIDNGKKVAADPNATKDQLNAAAKAIDDAMSGLVTKTDAARQVLDGKIATAEKLNQNNYTPETAKKLKDAIANGKKVSANKNATEAQLNAAAKVIDDAVKGLKNKVTVITNIMKQSPIGVDSKVADTAVKKLNKDGDIKGASFGKIKFRGWSKGKKAVLLRWTKTKGATKYVLYGNECNHTVKGKFIKYKYKKIKTFNAKTFKYIPKKIHKKKITGGKYYKFMMMALDKKGKVIAVSKTVHVTTAGKKFGNDKSIKRVSPKNGKVTLKVKKSRKLKVKEVRGKLKVQRHRVVAWETSNSKIATVKKGKVTAKKKGTCTIWAYAQNGVYTTFKVTVK